MPKGTFTCEAPHICGELIPVCVNWYDIPGSRLDPPEHNEEWVYYDNSRNHHCHKCGIDLDYDDIFYNTVNAIVDHTYAHGDTGECVPGDEMDYDPDD